MSTSTHNEEAAVLQLTLHGRLVGHVVGLTGGRNLLHFADEFRLDQGRPTFTLTTHRDFPKSAQLMADPWVKRQRLHPVLSNMLPEGALRELIARQLKVHIDNEFPLLAHLGLDLPGALVATPLAPDAVPPRIPGTQGRVRAAIVDTSAAANGFSLAGIQMKFSMKEQDGHYTLGQANALGDWIIKTPSTRHPQVPLNEFTCMSLAALAGVDIPAIRLVDLGALQLLPPISLPDEALAFAIRRFDRVPGGRVHAEDFAQVLARYPHQKYGAANYTQIGSILHRFSGHGLVDSQQLARRLLVNVLLANGDAHLKNWSLLYPDRVTPRLAPAYDIVCTSVYMQDERELALNLGKTKRWYELGMPHFKDWATSADLPWRAIATHLDDVMQRARSLWPEALQSLPMAEAQKHRLQEHWKRLQPEFRIEG
jgi:serine/threonine-protein kinase HipA